MVHIAVGASGRDGAGWQSFYNDGVGSRFVLACAVATRRDEAQRFGMLYVDVACLSYACLHVSRMCICMCACRCACMYLVFMSACVAGRRQEGFLPIDCRRSIHCACPHNSTACRTTQPLLVLMPAHKNCTTRCTAVPDAAATRGTTRAHMQDCTIAWMALASQPALSGCCGRAIRNCGRGVARRRFWEPSRQVWR